MLGWCQFYSNVEILLDELEDDFFAPMYISEFGNYSYRKELESFMSEMEKEYSFLTIDFLS